VGVGLGVSCAVTIRGSAIGGTPYCVFLSAYALISTPRASSRSVIARDLEAVAPKRSILLPTRFVGGTFCTSPQSGDTVYRNSLPFEWRNIRVTILFILGGFYF
jgi:hypothetical protein